MISDTIDGMDSETTEAITITLDASEAQFLLTILKASGSILTAIMSLQESLPGLSPPPIGTDAIAKIAMLAESIEHQTSK